MDKRFTYDRTYFSDPTYPGKSGLMETMIEFSFGFKKLNGMIGFEVDIFLIHKELLGNKQYHVLKSQSRYSTSLLPEINIQELFGLLQASVSNFRKYKSPINDKNIENLVQTSAYPSQDQVQSILEGVLYDIYFQQN